MIHLARALFVRSQPQLVGRTEPTLAAMPGPGRHKPVRARPLTPWGSSRPLHDDAEANRDAGPGTQGEADTTGQHTPIGPCAPLAQPGLTQPSTPHMGIGALAQPVRRRDTVRISTDPADARRTVIAGRFAQVCAALDRLVLEQEALA